MARSGSQTGDEIYEFGPFRVEAARERLLRNGESVSLTPKNFHILLVLLRHGNEVVTRSIEEASTELARICEAG